MITTFTNQVSGEPGAAHRSVVVRHTLWMPKKAREQKLPPESDCYGKVAVTSDGEWLRWWKKREGWRPWDERSDANYRPRDSIYPEFDWFMIRLLAGRWATPEELAEWARELHRPLQRSYKWFHPDSTWISEWLRSARKRRVVEQDPDVPGRWGLTDPRAAQRPVLMPRPSISTLGLLFAAAGFAAVAGVSRIAIAAVVLVAFLFFFSFEAFNPFYRTMVQRDAEKIWKLRQKHETRKAIGCYKRSLTTHRELGNRYAKAQTLHKLGVASLAIDDVAAAIEYLRKALAIFEDLGAGAEAEETRALLTKTSKRRRWWWPFGTSS
jgi:tetratricopeptide (TPR) repeat protein